MVEQLQPPILFLELDVDLGQLLHFAINLLERCLLLREAALEYAGAAFSFHLHILFSEHLHLPVQLPILNLQLGSLLHQHFGSLVSQYGIASIEVLLILTPILNYPGVSHYYGFQLFLQPAYFGDIELLVLTDVAGIAQQPRHIRLERVQFH